MDHTRHVVSLHLQERLGHVSYAQKYGLYFSISVSTNLRHSAEFIKKSRKRKEDEEGKAGGNQTHNLTSFCSRDMPFFIYMDTQDHVIYRV